MADPEVDTFWQNVQEAERAISQFFNVHDRLEELEHVAASDPELRQWWGRVMARWETLQRPVGVVRNAIARGRELLEGLGSWWEETTAGWGLQGRPALGVAPLVIAAITATITAGVTAIVAWVTDAQKLRLQLEERARLLEQGYSPSEARALTEEQEQRGQIERTLRAGSWLLGLALVWWIGSQLWESYQE